MRIATVFVCIALLLLSSCGGSKDKKREELSATGELFENTTAKFNGYFNAKEIWIASVDRLANGYLHNYNQRLPIFHFMANDQYASENDLMDKAIEKVATVVSKHPASDWVDDCYLLMAKSYFVKQDYENAINTLEYLANKYPPSYLEKIENNRVKTVKKSKRKKKRNKRKKKKNRTKTKTLTYSSINQYEVYDGRIVDALPAFYEALIWMGHAYTEVDQYIFAELALDRFEKYDDLPNRLTRAYHPVRAKWHLKQGQYIKAIESLEKSIEHSKNNYDKARYAFIIAQINEQLDQSSAAKESYKRAIGFKPLYDMVFAAELKILQIDARTGVDRKEIEKRLATMMEDGKNIEYLDQIFYGMGILEMEKNQQDDAIRFFNKAVQANVGDRAQLTESYYMLADIHYKKQDFEKAKYYYDSTMISMNKTDDRYFEVEAYSINLEGIAKNINTIRVNDSLLQLVNLNSEERRALAYQLQKEKEEGRENRRNNKLGNIAGLNKTPVNFGNRTPNNRPSSFFAYDEKTKKRGLKDFEKTWGDIELQDFWRVSAMRTQSDFDEVEPTNYESLVLSEEDVMRLTKFIPDSEEDQQKLNIEIQSAMLDLGVLYRDRLQRYTKSNRTLQELLDRYPESSKKVDALFFLYLNYNDLGEQDKAAVYKNKLIQLYPETLYAKALTNPEVMAMTLDKEQSVKQFYDQVFVNFNNGEYEQVMKMIDERDDKFGESTTYNSKFALLNAMCLGHLHGRERYISSLREVIGRYKGTDESRRAKEILDVLGLYKSDEPGSGLDSLTSDSTQLVTTVDHNFKYEPDTEHYALLSYNPAGLKVNDAKIAVSNFNNKYFRLDKLKVSNIFMTTSGDNPLLVMRKFENAKRAEAYCQLMIERQNEVFNGKAFSVYPISRTNYRELMRIKSVETYEQFYRQSYIK